MKAILTLAKQDAITRPASLITNATTSGDESLVECAPLSPDVTDDEEDWTMGDLVEVDAVERGGVKRRLRN